MSELPVYNTNSEARRRHHNNYETKTNTQTTEQNNLSEGSGGDLNYYSFQQFGNFSSLITPASNIWNAAQDISNLPIDMPFHDRTVEFRTVAKSCQFRHQPNGNILEAKGEREKMLQSSIHFNQLAKRIGRDLSMTCAKMEKLSQLAKNKSLFDDRASEIEELSQTIKQDITGLNKQIANLQQVALQRSGAKNNSSKNEQQGQNHSKLVVVGLQSKLASISKTFKNVLEIRTENLKLKRARREKFSQSAAIPSNLPPSASNGNSN
ncbi:unnamed protein product [Meloidogyne enterolobii]|uniref:Uncharacterized protein n=1 Tax=Meloidogyne enterolobii TaxID=390850 RepID=A0ACB0XYF2_MELEN